MVYAADLGSVAKSVEVRILSKASRMIFSIQARTILGSSDWTLNQWGESASRELTNRFYVDGRLGIGNQHDATIKNNSPTLSRSGVNISSKPRLSIYSECSAVW